MRRIEIPATGYGDCTVLLGSRSLLMVDCGSMNNKLRDPEMEMTGVFSFIQDRYSPVPERFFLLTHYHRDHLCGFRHIIKKDPRYFSKVFLPYISPDKDGGNPLLRLSLYAFAMAVPQSDIAQVNTSCVTLPLKLAEDIGCENIAFLKKGDTFFFDRQEFRVLNPQPAATYPAALYDMIRILDLDFPELADILDEFCQLYMEFQDLPDKRKLTKLRTIAEQIPEKAPLEASDIFRDQSFLRELAAAVNDSSVVFHNSISGPGRDNILMTGDISAEKFDELFPELHGSYYTIKAPHHGTSGGYSPMIPELEPEHILIHNDEYRSELSVTPDYTELECLRHCTGKLSCLYYKEYGSCCNRLTKCYNFSHTAELALRCPDIRRRGRIPGCGIYVVTPAGGRSCFCD